jgi:hypothetical protein
MGLSPMKWRRITKNLLIGLGLGALVATGFSLYATVLRLFAGPEPFLRNHTTYRAIVAVYFGGFLLGGLLIGLFLPFRRFLLGRMWLGMIGVFPVYLAVNMERSSLEAWFSSNNLFFALFASVIVGGGVGIWDWIDDRKKRTGSQPL